MYLDLKKCRMEKKLSIRELAALSNISKSTIQDVEQGVHLPSLKNYVKLCLALGINPFNNLLKK